MITKGVKKIPDKKYGVILPAAGSSSRFEKNKLVHQIKGRSLIEWAIKPYLESLNHFSEIVIVVGAFKQELQDHINHRSITFVTNDNFQHTDMFSSILLGIEHLKDQFNEIKGIFIHPADVPFVRKKDILEMVALFENQRGRIIVPSFHDQKGHPVLLPRQLLSKIQDMEGREGGLREILDRNEDKVTFLITQNEGVLIDIDYKKDITEYSYVIDTLW